jgi:hypothetical protein
MSHRAPNGAQEFLATKAINILLLRSKSTSSCSYGAKAPHLAPTEQKHLIFSYGAKAPHLAPTEQKHLILLLWSKSTSFVVQRH